MEPSGEDVQQWLKTTKVESVCPVDAEVIVVDANTNVDEAFYLLVTRGFQALPVFDKSTNQFVGFLKLADLLADIVDFCSLFKDEFAQFKQEFCHFREFLSALSHDRTVDVLTLASQRAFHSVPPGTTLHAVLRKMVDSGATRLAVQDAPNHLSGIITQSSMVKVLHTHQALFSLVLKGTIEETGFGLKKVFCVREDDPLIIALRLMRTHSVSAVGILDGEGRLLTTLTTSDLRALFSRTNFGFFQLTAMQFVQLSRQTQSKDSPGLFYAHPDTPLIKIVGILSATKRHRAFITDEPTGKPVGVVSLRDIVHFMMHHPALAE